MPPKRRNPRLSTGDKAMITAEAREMAKEISELRKRAEEAEQALGDQETRERAIAKLREKRQRRREQQLARREARRIENGLGRKCHGLNLSGNPCKAHPLVKENWDGPEEISGLYCLRHEPAIDYEARLMFQRTGTTKGKAYRRVTPGELAHEIIQNAPQHFLRPYLAVLGLKLDEETGEIKRVSTGLKLHGFSRGGTVIKSKYPDWLGQVQTVEKMFDRVYGKARQSMDIAANSTTVSLTLTMDAPRVERVTEILSQVGALNGSTPKSIDSTATELPEVPREEET